MHHLICIILVAERWFYHTGSYTLVRTYTCEPIDHIILAITYWLQHIGYDLLAITYWSWCNGYVSTVLLRYSTCPLHADKHLLEGSTIRPLHAFTYRFEHIRYTMLAGESCLYHINAIFFMALWGAAAAHSLKHRHRHITSNMWAMTCQA